MAMLTLTPKLASIFARLALSHIEREYPNKLDHVLRGPGDVCSPRDLHPLFYGSFDWHSCVHGYWLLATLRRRCPEIAEAAAISGLLERQLTDDNVAAEVAYLAQPMRGGFERPYGWAWVLMLAAELSRHEDGAWAATFAPLTEAIVTRFTEFLPKATYPVRVGTHFNTAFAITLALDYADTVHDVALGTLLREKAIAWYGDDVECQAWEPSGDDFLSSALIEAECMRHALTDADFTRWLDSFLPRIEEREPATLFEPAEVSDRSDGKIAHLDGLNLSRAWCWRSISQAFPEGDARRAIAQQTAAGHLAASLPHVAGDYMGEHWLASFAALALIAGC
jgi:hypothetical protein